MRGVGLEPSTVMVACPLMDVWLSLSRRTLTLATAHVTRMRAATRGRRREAAEADAAAARVRCARAQQVGVRDNA